MMGGGFLTRNTRKGRKAANGREEGVDPRSSFSRLFAPFAWFAFQFRRV